VGGGRWGHLQLGVAILEVADESGNQLISVLSELHSQLPAHYAVHQRLQLYGELLHTILHILRVTIESIQEKTRIGIPNDLSRTPERGGLGCLPSNE